MVAGDGIETKIQQLSGQRWSRGQDPRPVVAEGTNFESTIRGDDIDDSLIERADAKSRHVSHSDVARASRNVEMMECSRNVSIAQTSAGKTLIGVQLRNIVTPVGRCTANRNLFKSRLLPAPYTTRQQRRQRLRQERRFCGQPADQV